MKKKLLFLLTILITVSLFAQTKISYNGSGNFILIEKTDLRRYDNGKYTGLVSREISSYITPEPCEDGYLYEGNFYVWQDTMRNAYSLSGGGMQDTILSKFKIGKDGQFTMLKDYGYPSFRSFPSFTDKEIKIGDKWQAKAERAVDPLNKGIVTRMPIFVEYQYQRDTVYRDEECYVLSAQWATRYGMGGGVYHIDWGGDQDLEKATGTHRATIYVSKETGNALVIQDNVDETYLYKDGNQIQFKGTVSQFTEYPPAVDRSKLIPALKRIAEISDEMEKSLAQKENVNDSTKTGDFQDNNPFESENNSEYASLSGIEKDEVSGLHGNNDEVSDLMESKKGEVASLSGNRKIDVSSLTGNKKTEGSNLYGNKKGDVSNLPEVEKTGGKSLVTVDNTPAGIRLTIPDLQFVPDSSELLGNEKSRLDKIAEVLNTVPDCKFLIEGHTASTGKPTGEMQLSLERAHAIAQALIDRGISAQRIICKGSGGTKPVADNNTAEGKARNRRVEITILE